jgi:hypothetical protein|tara:strand:+ start:858 stop:1049 length:192 start_codon:yes stop_codon:yes gene_type:complete
LGQRGERRQVNIDGVKEGDDQIEDRAANNNEIKLVPGVVEICFTISSQFQNAFDQENGGEEPS